MTDPKGTRERFSGQPSDLADVGRPHMNVPSFLAYSEKMITPKVVPKLTRHSAMWREVRCLHSNMSFSQNYCEKAFELAGERAGSSSQWQRSLTIDEMATWKTSISKQFRCMARHIMQSKDTAWFKRMFSESDTEAAEHAAVEAQETGEAYEGQEAGGEEDNLDEGKDDDQEAEENEDDQDEDEIEWIIKYDKEAHSAYRVNSKNESQVEWGMMVVEDGKNSPLSSSAAVPWRKSLPFQP